MAYLRATLVVLTLLQLHRAEILDTLPDSWYSANVIQDGFQPKPISEIFSTETTFSSSNPIIILPKSSVVSEEIGILSTLTPPSIPPLITDRNLGFTQVLPLTGSTLPTTTSELPQPQPQPQPQPPQIAVQIQTEPEQTTSSESIQPIVQPIQSIIQPAQPDGEQQTRSRSSQNQSQQIRLELVPQVLPISNQPEPPTQQPITQPPIVQASPVTPQSNFFLIYQQAPQSIQNFQPPPQPSQPLPPTPQTSQSSPPPQPSSIPIETLQVSLQSTTSQPVPTLVAQPVPTVTIQSVPSMPPQPSTSPPTVTSQTVPTTQNPPTTFRPAATSRNCLNVTNPRPATRMTTLIPRPGPIVPYPLRIRVIAPSGSITNVNINPTTTTKRPTTTRTRKPKPKKNNYQVCIDSCKGKKQPICAAPRAPGLIDSKTLKGFPSVCHMACHNSFRKEIYERLVDGRCGRLRTRIRTAGSKTKLKRQELIKTEYTVENTGAKTVIELSGPI